MSENRRIPLTLFILFFSTFAFSQGENNIWYFSRGYGLDFNTHPPNPIEGGQYFLVENGVAAVSDQSGQLLFYTNGDEIYDRFHQQMPNGFDLNGYNVLIVPMPDDVSKFYIFTLRNPSHVNSELTYSIVDINLNAGKGDIISNKKKLPLALNVTSKLVASKGMCREIWVLTHEKDNNRFKAYKIDDSGISDPVISDTGSAQRADPYSSTAWRGQMKISPDNSRIALTTLSGIVEVFDFDRMTGIISNPITLTVATVNNRILQPYGLCFSPNSKLLYVNEGIRQPSPEPLLRKLFQYDISLANSLDVVNSKTLIGEPEMVSDYHFDMQLGPDSLIYVARRHRNYLGVIQHPNIKGTACTYKDEGFFLGNQNFFDKSDLQNLVVAPEPTEDEMLPLLPSDQSICMDQNLTLHAQFGNGLISWSTGSLDTSIMVYEAGLYSVELQIGDCFYYDSIHITQTALHLDLGPDTILCQNDSIILNAYSENATYYWQDGTTDAYRRIDQPGVYHVKLKKNGCEVTDSILVEYHLINPDLGPDTTLCTNESVTLEISHPGASYLWQDNSKENSYSVFVPGTYWVEVQIDHCLERDTIEIQYQHLALDLGDDIDLCPEEETIIGMEIPFGEYIWQDGSNQAFLMVNQAGHYWAKVTLDHCTISDTIYVRQITLPLDLGLDTKLCPGEIIVLTPSIQADNYLWQNGSTENNMIVNEPGLYWLELVNGDCIFRDSIFIDIDQNCTNKKVFIPNIFSPNADGTHDRFMIHFQFPTNEYSIMIFDRWGELVYESENPYDSWDGSFRGEPLQSGVFLVVLSYLEETSSIPRIKYSSLTLIR